MAAPHVGTVRFAAVIYNPSRVDVGRLRRQVVRAEPDDWAPSLWLATTADDAGVAQAHTALAAGAAVVIVAGGDGTVRAVAEVLRGSGVPLAVVPAGTGNLLARNLELNLARPGEAVRGAFRGRDRSIDLAVAEVERPDGSREQRAYLVMAGIGLDAQMVAHTNPQLKRRVGWIAYVQGIARGVRAGHKVRVRYRIDGGELRAATVNTALVGNCGMLPGNVVVLPEAKIDDGILDIVALRPNGFVGWAQIWAQITWQNALRRGGTVGRQLVGALKPVRALRYERGASIQVWLERPEPFELDGDQFGDAVGFRVFVDPGALVVRVPDAVRRATAPALPRGSRAASRVPR